MLFSRKAVSKRHLLLIAAGFSTVLTGCATSPSSKVASSTKVDYYPSCYEPVQHLRATDSDMTKSVVTGAAGYYTARQKQISDDNQRIASYTTDFNKSASDIDSKALAAIQTWPIGRRCLDLTFK